MNIKALINSQYNALQTLFNAYGINKPVNVDNVSAAIVLYKTENGNMFLEDLMLLNQSENNYEDFLKRNPEKKAAAQARRQENGGTRLGSLIRKVVPKKQAPATTTVAPIVINSTKNFKQAGDTVSDLAIAATTAAIEDANPGGKIAERAPGMKIEDVFAAAGQAASGIAGGISTLRNSGNNDNDENIDVNQQAVPGWKKYLPWIIGGVVIIGLTVIVLATRKK